MRNSLILSVLLGFILVGTSPVPGAVMLQTRGEKVKAIVIGTNSSPAAKAGAQELQYYLAKITGETLPIKSEHGSVPSVAIFVGESSYTRKAGISITNLKPESFIIRSIKGGLVLLGDDGPGDPFKARVKSGTLFAVYDFLEKYGQIRWLWPGEDGEVIPQQSNLTIPELNIREEPAFVIRSVGLGSPRLSKNPDMVGTEAKKWSKRQKMGWIPQMWFGHSVGTHFPKEQYYATHPEYYALVKGIRVPYQLCTSNQDMQKELVSKILNAKQDVVSISPSDGGNFCECENCKALDIPGLYYKGKPPRPDLSQRIFTFANRVATAVQKVDPKKGVGIFAYTYYRLPPQQIDRLENNIYLSYTYSNTSFNDPDYKKNYYNLITAWSAKGVRLVAREYWGTHYFLDLPVIQLQGLAENLPFLQKKGFVAIYGEGGKNFATMGVNYYLLAKLMWNPQLNPEEIMADYYQAAYGPAAPVMKQYWEFLENLLRKNWAVLDTQGQGPGYVKLVLNWHNLLPLSELEKAEKYLKKAQSLVQHQPEYRRRIDYATYGLDYTKIMVQLLPLYAKLQAAGVKIGFARDPRLTSQVDQKQIRQWLLEAYRLGEARKKMLFSPENINSFRLDEGLFIFAEEYRKKRPWHQRVSEASRRLSVNHQK